MRKGIAGGPCTSAPEESGAQPQDQQTEEAETAMAKAVPGGSPPATVSLPALPARGGGTRLPAEARTFMEPRFGFRFDAVRVHADAEADALNRALSAEAFTLGTHLYFRAGRFNPSTEGGRRLLAHELAHVVQQSEGRVGGTVQRFTLNGFPPTEEAAMRAAIPVASATMRSCTGVWLHNSIASKIDGATYNYNADLGLCGHSYPVPWSDIEIGKDAFSYASCCKLESTIAHEASHTRGFVESRARKLECNCFSCCV